MYFFRNLPNLYESYENYQKKECLRPRVSDQTRAAAGRRQGGEIPAGG